MELPKEKSKATTSINDFIYLIYGEPKIGKTTFCANFENALFIATEPGHKFQEVYKVDPKNWEEILVTVKKLITEKHQFKTVIIDTADNAFKMCEEYVGRKHGFSHPSDLGFGKGWGFLKDEFSRVPRALAQHGFGVIFISHARTDEITEGGIKRNYTNSTLTGSAKGIIHPLCDFIFYINADKDKKRWIRTKPTVSINAGDRSGKLAELIDATDFESFKTEVNKAINQMEVIK